jgi:hypothetical protein
MNKTIAAVAAALTLAGCSSSGATGAAAAPGGSSSIKDACSLLTDEQVTKILDKAPTKHDEDKTIPTIKNCKWETGDDLASMSIAYGKTSDYPVANIDDGKWEKLSGVGEKAGFLLGVMVVSSGGYNFQVTGGPNDIGMAKDAKTEQQKARLTEAAGYAMQALGVGGPVKEAPKTTKTTDSSEKPEKTTSSKPTKTSDAADEDTDTKTSETTEESEPSASAEN